jgi:hypothetical protein
MEPTMNTVSLGRFCPDIFTLKVMFTLKAGIETAISKSVNSLFIVIDLDVNNEF